MIWSNDRWEIKVVARDDLIGERSDGLMIWSNEKKGELGESESNQRQGEGKNY